MEGEGLDRSFLIAQAPVNRVAMEMTDEELADAYLDAHSWFGRLRERVADWLAGDISVAIDLEWYARCRGVRQWRPHRHSR